MCKVGDIIVIKDCKTEMGNIMFSLEGKGEEYKKKKLSYPENMPYDPSEENIINGHGKEGFIKAGVYFLFNRADIDFTVIGNVQIELYLKLIDFIKHMNPEDIRYILDNLKATTD